jgi:cytochrome c oxidase subunit 4
MANHVAPGSHDAAHGHGQGQGHGEEHATEQTYVRIAIILAIITAVEVVIYYMPSVRPILVPALIILSIAKFAAVVGYFMHLKYDSKIFRFMFVSGLVLSLAVYLAMIAMFWTASSYQPILHSLFE